MDPESIGRVHSRATEGLDTGAKDSAPEKSREIAVSAS